MTESFPYYMYTMESQGWLTPYLTSNVTFDEYWGNFMNTMRRILSSLG